MLIQILINSNETLNKTKNNLIYSIDLIITILEILLNMASDILFYFTIAQQKFPPLFERLPIILSYH
jgi:hypothetical protein